MAHCMTQPFSVHPYGAALRRSASVGSACHPGFRPISWGRQHRLQAVRYRAPKITTCASKPPAASAPAVSSLAHSASSLSIAAAKLLPVWALGAAAWALQQPTAFVWFKASHITAALSATMLGVGLSLKLEDFKCALLKPGHILVGVVLQYTLLPAAAVIVCRILNLPPPLALGLGLVASCPGASAANVAAFLAQGDMAFSVLLTAASTLAAVYATPAVSGFLLGAPVPVNALGLLVPTAQVVMLPALLGAAIGRAAPAVAQLLRPAAELAATALLTLACGSVVAHSAGEVLQAAPGLLGAVVLLHSGGLLLGYTASRSLGLPERAARVAALHSGMRNSALAAFLAARYFPAYPAAAAACALTACTHPLLGSLLAAAWRWRGAGGAAGSQRSGQQGLRELQPQGKPGGAAFSCGGRGRAGAVTFPGAGWEALAAAMSTGELGKQAGRAAREAGAGQGMGDARAKNLWRPDLGCQP